MTSMRKRLMVNPLPMLQHWFSTNKVNSVSYQKKTTYADHSKRRKTLDKTSIQQTLLEFSAYGKGPPSKSFVGRISADWFNHTGNCLSIQSLDLAWAMVRLCPTKLFQVTLPQVTAAEQKVPAWSAFNAMVHQQAPVKTTIRYCPMINSLPTDCSTVYTVMKNLQQMMESLGQRESVITFDLAIYVKAKEIQWRRPDEFGDMVVRMGGFHIILNYFSLMGKKFENFGLEDFSLKLGCMEVLLYLQSLKAKRTLRVFDLTS